MNKPISRRVVLKTFAIGVGTLSVSGHSFARNAKQSVSIDQLVEDYFATSNYSEDKYHKWQRMYQSLDARQLNEFYEACAVSVQERYKDKEEGLAKRVAKSAELHRKRNELSQSLFGRSINRLTKSQSLILENNLKRGITPDVPSKSPPSVSNNFGKIGLMKPASAGCGESRNLSLTFFGCCGGDSIGYNWVQCPDWDVWTYFSGYRTWMGGMNANGSGYISFLWSSGRLQIAGDYYGFTRALIGGNSWYLFFWGSWWQFNTSIKTW